MAALMHGTIVTDVKVTMTHGLAGERMASVRVAYSDGTFYRTTFWGSAYGGPVFVQVVGDILRVSDPARFGAELDATWVRRYYGLN